MENVLQTFWTEKYRPKKLEDIILPEKEKDNIYQAIKSGNIPHYLFIGPPGTGKTSLAKVIINELNAISLIINASEERGIDTIRDKVMRFVQVATDKPKIVFLDEADALTGEAQASLRNVMETYSDYCRFILTGNYDKFIAPIKDRCEIVRFKQLSKQDCLGVLRKIVVSENVEIEGDELDKIINTFYPSIRKMIANLQKYSIPIKNQNGEVIGYKLQLPEKLSKEDEVDFETIYKMFIESGNIYQIRDKLYELGVTDFIPLYRFFFRKFVESGDELSAIIVTEYMYRDTFVADKELNFTGMLLSLKNKAYPFVLANNISAVVDNNQKINSSPSDNNLQTSNNSTSQELPSNIVQLSNTSKISKLPKPKPKLPKVNSVTNNQSTIPVKSTTKNPALQNLNSLLKKSTSINNTINTSTSDFDKVVDDIYNSLSE